MKHILIYSLYETMKPNSWSLMSLCPPSVLHPQSDTHHQVVQEGRGPASAESEV